MIRSISARVGLLSTQARPELLGRGRYAQLSCPAASFWMQRAYCATQKPLFCRIQIDAQTSLCRLETLTLLDKKVWAIANEMLMPRGFVWDKVRYVWEAPLTALSKESAEEVKSYVDNAQLQTSQEDRATSQDKNFNKWAQRDEKEFISHFPHEMRRLEKALKKGAPATDEAKPTVKTPAPLDAGEVVDSFMRGVSSEMERLLPVHIDKKRFKRLVEEALHRVESLPTLEKASVRKAILTAALFGLEPDSALQHAYFMVTTSKLHFAVMYRGLMELAERSGEVRFLSAKCVYKEDSFSVVQGDSPSVTHTPYPDPRERGELTGVYAICAFTDGSKRVVVLPYASVTRFKRIAKRMQDPLSTWYHWKEEMLLKMAIKRVLKESHNFSIERRN